MQAMGLTPKMDEGTFAGRLAVLVGKYPTQQAAAAAAGISLSQLKRYLAGQNEPSLHTAALLAGGADVSLDWLVSGTKREQLYGWGDQTGEEITPPPADVSTLPDSWASIPIYDVEVAAGQGRAAEDTPANYLFAAEERWIRKILRRGSQSLAGVHVVGDSMSPTLFDGDVVVVDLAAQNEPLVDGIHVLNIDNHLFVKRLMRRMDGMLIVRSDNTAYPEETVDPRRTPVKVYGRVIAAFHQL